MSIVIKALKMGLTEGGKYIAGEAASEISKVFLKLIGYESEKDKKEKEMIAWMKSVTEQLTTLNAMVGNLSIQVNEGFTEIKKDSFYNAYLSQNQLAINYFTTIDGVYKKFTDVITKKYKDEIDAKNAIDKFVKDIDLDKFWLNAQNLARLYLQNYHGADRNLLENYTDMCIVSMYDDVSSFSLNYNNLEYNFLNGITGLTKAYAIMVAIKNYTSGVPVDKSDKETAGWLDDEAAAIFSPMAEGFLSCVDRLMLATYQPQKAVKSATIFADPLATWNAGSRSQALTFLFANMDVNKKSPGLVITEFLRPSLLDDKGKCKIKITPKGKAEIEITGENIKAPAKYYDTHMTWYKVVDKNKKGQLLAFEDSNIAVIRYSRAYEELAVGDNSPHFEFTCSYRLNNLPADGGRASYAYYDPDTLRELDKKKDNSICIAYATIINSLGVKDKSVEAFPISYPRQAGVAYSKSAGKNPLTETGMEQFQWDPYNKSQLAEHGKQTSVEGPLGVGNPIINSVEAKFSAPMFSTNHDMRFYTNYYIDYAAKTGKDLAGKNTDKTKLMLLNSAEITVHIGDYKSFKLRMRSCQVSIQVFADIPGEKRIYFHNNEYGSNTNIKDSVLVWNQKNDNVSIPTASEPATLGIPLKGGAKTKIVFEVDFWLKGLDAGMDLTETINHVIAKIVLTGRFVWPYAKFK